MNQYKVNELEDFEHPYELEYSSLKSSKNESLKVHNIKENNNNLLGINNNNKSNYQNQDNENAVNNQNNNSNVIKVLNNSNSINNINNENNFRLNEQVKKNIENLIGNNKSYNKIKPNENKSKSKSKSKNKKININNNSNNNHAFSSVKDYWEIREKKNREKMEKIKKERENKIYGELYPKPKINKNTQEIIERLRERTYDNIPIEDQQEDKINKNIPKRTKQNNLFKSDFFNLSKTSKKTKLNKSIPKIRVKNSYDNLMKIKINNKRPKTPNPKKSKLKRKKIKKKSNLDKLSAADIKNLEMIMKLRNEEENEKIKILEERMKLENDYIEEKIKEEDEENSPEKIKKDNNKNINNFNIDQKVNNYMNKSMNLISLRSKSSKDWQINNNINEIMTSRKYLNDIYSRDKKIINHSFIQLSNNRIPKTSNQRNIEVFYKYKNKSRIKKEKPKTTPKLNKSFNQNNSYSDYNSQSLYDSKTKSLRYKHYTEGGSYSYNLKNINSNDINNKNEKNNSLDPDKVNKNVVLFNPHGNKNYNNNNINYNNNINVINNSIKEIQEKNNELNLLYNKEYNYKNNQLNQIKNELDQESLVNQQLLTQAKNLENNVSKEYKNIILKNQSINNIFNELDNESLLKYREENNQKLYELNQNQKNNNKKINLPTFLQKQFEESKNITNQIDKDMYRKINAQKFRNILGGEQQKIENNLDYYNKELKINEKKKELLLNKMFGDNYTKERKIKYEKKNENNYINNYINNKLNDNNRYGVNKYLIQNNDFSGMNDDENENNKYKFVYSPYKMVNNEKKEIKKEEMFKNNEDDVVGSFDFHRRHHFS